MVSLKSSDAELMAFALAEMTAHPQGNPHPRRIDTPFRTHLRLPAAEAAHWSSEQILLEQVSKVYFAEHHLRDATLTIREFASSRDLQVVLEEAFLRSASLISQFDQIWTPTSSGLLGQNDWAERAGGLLVPGITPAKARDEWIVFFEHEAAASQAEAYRLALLWAELVGQSRFSAPLSAGVEAAERSTEDLRRWLRANIRR